MIPIKSLNLTQMKYIMSHYETMTAAEMANVLQVEDVNVMIFCQANKINPLPRKVKGREVNKHKDSYHVIPIQRKQKMASKNYHRKMDRV